jgi:hypothetical protein
MKRSFSNMNEGAFDAADPRSTSAKVAHIGTELSDASAAPTAAVLELRHLHAAFLKHHGAALQLLDDLKGKYRAYNLKEMQRYDAAVHAALEKRSNDPEGHAKIIRTQVEELRMAVRHLEQNAIKARVEEIYDAFDNEAWEGFVKGGEACGLSVVDKHLHLDIETDSDETIEKFSDYTKEKLQEAKVVVKANRLLEKVEAAVAYAPTLARYRILKAVNCKSEKRQQAELIGGEQYKCLEDVNFIRVALDSRLYINVTACCKALEKRGGKEKELATSRRGVQLTEWKRRQNIETASNHGVYKCKRESDDDCDYYYNVNTKDIVERPEGFKSWAEL